MRSTAGVLTLCFVLSVNLCPLFTAHPVHTSCKIRKLLQLLEHELKELNSTLTVNHVVPDPEIIHQLAINKSFPESAACGLVYMKRALERIRDHQRKLIDDEHVQKQFKDILARLKHAAPCTQHRLPECDHPPQPEFPVYNHRAKQWTLSFFESAVKFLHRLVHLLESLEERQ